MQSAMVCGPRSHRSAQPGNRPMQALPRRPSPTCPCCSSARGRSTTGSSMVGPSPLGPKPPAVTSSDNSIERGSRSRTPARLSSSSLLRASHPHGEISEPGVSENARNPGASTGSTRSYADTRLNIQLMSLSAIFTRCSALGASTLLKSTECTCVATACISRKKDLLSPSSGSFRTCEGWRATGPPRVARVLGNASSAGTRATSAPSVGGQSSGLG